MLKSKIFNVIISGIATILFFVALMFFILGLHILATKISLLVIIWRALQILAIVFTIGMVWFGIYDRIRERQEIKEYINKDE